jgi:hypothetical protein
MLNNTILHDSEPKLPFHSKQDSFSSFSSQTSVIHGSGLGNGRTPTPFRVLTPQPPGSREGLMQGAAPFVAGPPQQYMNRQPTMLMNTGGYGPTNTGGYSAYRGREY